MKPSRDVIPRKHFVFGPVAGHEPIRIETLRGHGVEPASELEVLRPLLERATGTPDPLDHRADSAVTSGRNALCERGLGIMPAHLRCTLAKIVAQHVDLAMQFFGAVLTEPLERSVRLRNEAPDRHRATRLLGVLLPDLDDVACEFGDAEGVLVHLRRQPDEEVQLHPPPTL